MQEASTFKHLCHLIRADLYRYTGRSCASDLGKYVLAGGCFKYLFWMRVCKYAQGLSGAGKLVYVCARVILNHYEYKFGLQIAYQAAIGPGLLVGHFGGIVVNANARIGANCNLSHGVTIGVARRGKCPGVPTIGNNVYIGPGAKVFGGITIGSDVAIGANAVVNEDVPDGVAVAGIPARIISREGSRGLVNRTNYAAPSARGCAGA